MRDYENSDTSSFNTYRSGTENPRRELSSRTGYGSPASVTRRGSTFGTADHFQNNSLYRQPHEYREYGRQEDQRKDQNQSDQNRYQRDSWQGNRDSYNAAGNYGNRQQDHQSRWPQDNRQHQSNYGNHSQDRDYDRHRSGERNYFERAGDQMNQRYNRWDNNSDRNDRDYRNSQNNRSDQNRSSYNSEQNQNRYSGDYGRQNQHNTNRNFDENRYSHRRHDYDRDDHEGEGFFDRVGNYISNAWNNLTSEEREDRERADRYNRQHDDDSRGYTRTSSNSGPPYSYGSASRRDYEW